MPGHALGKRREQIGHEPGIDSPDGEQIGTTGTGTGTGRNRNRYNAELSSP